MEVSRTTAAPRGSLQRSVLSAISAKASLVRKIEPLAFRRQRHAARASLEQFQSEPAFELGDLPADRAMRDVEVFGGRAETAGTGGGLETAQRFERKHGFQAVIHAHSRAAHLFVCQSAHIWAFLHRHFRGQGNDDGADRTDNRLKGRSGRNDRGRRHDLRLGIRLSRPSAPVLPPSARWNLARCVLPSPPFPPRSS